MLEHLLISPFTLLTFQISEKHGCHLTNQKLCMCDFDSLSGRVLSIKPDLLEKQHYMLNLKRIIRARNTLATKKPQKRKIDCSKRNSLPLFLLRNFLIYECCGPKS